MDKTKWENMKTPAEKLTQQLLDIGEQRIENEGITVEELTDAIAALPAIKTKRRLVVENEQRKAKAHREGALTIQQQIAAKKAADQEKKEYSDRELKASLNSKRQKIEADVKAEIEKAQQKKIADAEREENRKAELKVWRKQSKAREEQRKQEGVEQAKRTEASRVSKIKTIIGRVNLILSDADVLYSDLKSFRDPRRANDAEKEQIAKALDAASKRCTNAKRLLKP